MSWNDKLSYQENVDIFLESLKDFSKTEDNTYKVTKDLLNLKHLSTQKVFAKLYIDVYKRLKNDFLKVKFINTKELVEIKYKDELVFSYKPARYIYIPTVLKKISKEISEKETQLRDMRDGIIAGNATQKMLNDIEKLKLTVMGLYEKQNVLREVHETLNKKKNKKDTAELQQKQNREKRVRVIELKKQMKESFTSRDIHKFQMAAKEIAELDKEYLDNVEKENKDSYQDLKDFLLIRSPEIIVNNKDIGKKKPKKTAKKPKKKEDVPPQEEGEKKEKKEDKKPKKTKKKEQKGSGEDEGESKPESSNKDTTLEIPEQMKGGFNLLEHLNNQIGGNNKADEFEAKDELSLNITGMIGDEPVENQVGAGSEENTNIPASSESFHTTPPFGPDNISNMSVPNEPQVGGNISPDVKVVSVSEHVMGGMVSQEQPQQTGGTDPFVNLEPDLQSVSLDSMEQKGGFEDMTANINSSLNENPTEPNMNGGSYGGSSSHGVFDTTYHQDQYSGSNMNSNSTDPFGLGQMPENINVSVTKLP